LEEGREGDDAGVLFGPFLERISFVDREREGDDIGAPFTPSPRTRPTVTVLP
jgi:hypothetical protein